MTLATTQTPGYRLGIFATRLGVGPDGKDSENDVSVRSLDYRRMAMKWDLISDLLGGTPAMQEAGERWLPRMPSEEPLAWECRLFQSFLYGALSDTLTKLVSKPFSRPVVVKESDALDEMLQSIEDDANNRGQDITQFAQEMFEEALKWGVAHVLVDFPKGNMDENGNPLQRTLAEERELGVHPYFTLISARDLIGWRYRETETGESVLTQIRYKSSQMKPHGAYGDKAIEVIYVWNAPEGESPGTWEIHEEQEDSPGEFKLTDKGQHTYPGIPLTSVYSEQTGFMTADPPLEELAWENLMHWQSQSDQRNILRAARCGVIFRKGFSKEELKKKFAIGPFESFGSTNEAASMEWVEHSGAAIEAGRRDILDIESRMEVLGLQPLMERTGGVTATGRSMDEQKSNTAIQAWIRNLSNCLGEAYRIAMAWTKNDSSAVLPDSFAIEVFSDFSIGVKAATNMMFIEKARERSDIDQSAYLGEMQRYGILSEAINIEEQVANTEAERQKNAEMMMALGISEEGPDEDQDEDGEAEDPEDGSE